MLRRSALCMQEAVVQAVIVLACTGISSRVICEHVWISQTRHRNNFRLARIRLYTADHLGLNIMLEVPRFAVSGISLRWSIKYMVYCLKCMT